MAEGSGFDMSKLGTAQKIVGGAAAAFFIWTFLPVWYSCCEVGGVSTGALGGATAGMSGFRFPIMLAWLLAIAALAGVVMTAMGTEMKMSIKPGTVQMYIGIAALVLTLLGFVIKPSAFTVSAGVSWGLFVGIIIAAAWAYGGYMWNSEPGGSAPPAA